VQSVPNGLSKFLDSVSLFDDGIALSLDSSLDDDIDPISISGVLVRTLVLLLLASRSDASGWLSLINLGDMVAEE
jgi:hypothetical protein